MVIHVIFHIHILELLVIRRKSPNNLDYHFGLSFITKRFLLDTKFSVGPSKSIGIKVGKTTLIARILLGFINSRNKLFYAIFQTNKLCCFFVILKTIYFLLKLQRAKVAMNYFTIKNCI